MLIHLTPALHAYRGDYPDCALLDLQSAELGLHLRDGIELTARRPYPNKNYLVACRKKGAKAVNGILVESGPLQEFTVTTRWAVGKGREVTHNVKYQIVDSDHDAATDYMVLWSAMSKGLGGFRSRELNAGGAPVHSKPRMDLERGMRKGEFVDQVDGSGRIIVRSEVFNMPTVERERVLFKCDNSLFDRMPTADMAFQAGA